MNLLSCLISNIVMLSVACLNNAAAMPLKSSSYENFFEQDKKQYVDPTPTYQKHEG